MPKRVPIRHCPPPPTTTHPRASEARSTPRHGPVRESPEQNKRNLTLTRRPHHPPLPPTTKSAPPSRSPRPHHPHSPSMAYSPHEKTMPARPYAKPHIMIAQRTLPLPQNRNFVNTSKNLLKNRN